MLLGLGFEVLASRAGFSALGFEVSVSRAEFLDWGSRFWPGLGRKGSNTRNSAPPVSLALISGLGFEVSTLTEIRVPSFSANWD